MHFAWDNEYLIFLFVALSMLVIGANKWKWYINEISALFLALGVVSATIYRLSMKDSIDSFIAGAKDMITAGLIIGLSRGLLVMLPMGKSLIVSCLLYQIGARICHQRYQFNLSFYFNRVSRF